MAVCGTTTGYSQGCRCDDCGTARREYLKRRRATDYERVRQQERNSDARNPDRFKLYQRKRRAEQPEEVKRQKREWYARHADRIKRQGREQYAANPEPAKASAARWRNADPEHARKTYRTWRNETGKGAAYSSAQRARVRDAFVEDVDPLVVFDRDKYVCQRCGTQCQRSSYPARDYATVDHVIALTNGGEHSYSNTQTLCFSCNAAKGNRR